MLREVEATSSVEEAKEVLKETALRKRRLREILLNAKRCLTKNSKATGSRVDTPSSKRSALTMTLTTTSRKLLSLSPKLLKARSLPRKKKQLKNEWD